MSAIEASKTSSDFWKLLRKAKHRKAAAELLPIDPNKWEAFWEELYELETETQMDIEHYQLHLHPMMLRLPPRTMQSPTVISQQEKLDAIARVPKNKSPGLDLVLPAMFLNPSPA